jgi:phosphotransacetylase
MLEYPQEFNHIVEKAKSFNRPWQVAVAGANSENILQGVFAAQEAGFAEPILIGNFKKTKEMLDNLGLADRKYDFYPVSSATSPVQYAIEMIQAGSADVLVRGNIQTRDFLLPIMNKSNHLIEEGKLVTHINVMRFEEYPRLISVSDCTLLVEPSIEQREDVIRNMVEALSHFGIRKPNIALLSLVEKPSFHMRDTVEAQTIVMHHKEEPIADCNLFGPITYDLIISKEAARLKHYKCEYCGEFDGIVVPNLLAGNLICKFWDAHLTGTGCSVLVGARIPVAISGRSESPTHAFLSLAASIAMKA